MNPDSLEKMIFQITNEEQFNATALEVFNYQYNHNVIYKSFCDFLSVPRNKIDHYTKIPFLPIEFFKHHKIISGTLPAELVFTSSGTTDQTTSRHYVCKRQLYETSFIKAFELFVGKPGDFHILALLPSYLERGGSSLVYMVDRLIALSKSEHSGFYLHNTNDLRNKILHLSGDNRKVLLIGVSFALLDLAEQIPFTSNNLMIMETGGMKGKRKEILREELHLKLSSNFGVKKIWSEYGMTELLSQAYSDGDGIFSTPPWMKVVIRDATDPLADTSEGRTGSISVIDLANLYSCSFIATRDLGRKISANKFLVLGRFDHSDTRGCNLMVG
jgi:hypothetical protein